MLLAWLAGTAAGALHVVGGPDHLAAIAPLAVARHERPWWTGLAWGAGHSLSIWLIASVFVLAGTSLPQDWFVAASSERLVGIVLVAVGLWGIRRALRTRVHRHEHVHGGLRHNHAHLHAGSRSGAHRHGHSSFAIGLLHGVAGSPHAVIVPAMAVGIRTGESRVAFLLGFGAGSIVAMVAFATLVGAVGRRLERSWHWILSATSTAAIAVGVWWIAVAV